MRRSFRRMAGALAALVLPTAAAVAVNTQPAWAAAAWRYPGPSIATTQGGAAQYVVWAGGGGALWQAKRDNGTWRGPFHLAQAGTMGSEPDVAVVGANPYIVWQGTDGHLWLTYWNSGQWRGACNLGMGQLGSRPSISVSDSGTLTVGWKGTNGYLWYAYSTTNPSCSGWSGPHSLNTGVMGSSPAVTGHAGGQYLDAAWSGAGSSSDMWWRQGNGILKDLGLSGINSPPSLVSLTNSTWDGFWAGRDGHLWSAAWRYTVTGGTNVVDQAFQIGAAGTIGSAPSAAFDSRTYYVVWKGTDAHLWWGTCDLVGTCWSVSMVPGMGTLG
jgi:hypothetical protein